MNNNLRCELHYTDRISTFLVDSGENEYVFGIKAGVPLYSDLAENRGNDEGLVDLQISHTYGDDNIVDNQVMSIYQDTFGKIDNIINIKIYVILNSGKEILAVDTNSFNLKPVGISYINQIVDENLKEILSFVLAPKE